MNRYNDKGKILLQRMFIVSLGSALLLWCLICRLYYLQIIEGEKYQILSNQNRITTQVIIPPRGRIFDRNGEVLADNIQNFQAVIIPEQTNNLNETLEKFKTLIPLDENEEAKIKAEIRKNKRFVPVILKSNLSWHDVALIQLHTPDMPGISIIEGLSRVYPLGQSTAHILGYIGSVSEKEKSKNPLFSIPGFKIGKAGIEKQLDETLRGRNGSIKLEVNAFGRIMKEIERDAGSTGQDVYLTIDSRLQKVAETAFKDESGAAVVMDVHSGEVLAMVSLPSFDPNMFKNGISHKEWNKLLNNERHPLINKAMSEHYSPGSTFKIIVALAALEAGKINLNTSINCNGAMELGQHKFHCWKHSGHGFLNVISALKHSCDIFFYETALKTGIEKIASTARMFGLESDYGLKFDNIQKGLIPDEKWKQERFHTKWQKGETVIAGIGQGYVLVTPLQLATMLSRVVNGGYEVSPHFIKMTMDDKASIRKIPVGEKNLEIVKEGMFEVVNSEGGTARRAYFNINGAKLAGKTGTTQVRRISMKERQTGIISDDKLDWHLRNHALFIGYTPHDNPKYAVAVIVEHGSSGSAVAAPIASQILKKALELKI